MACVVTFYLFIYFYLFLIFLLQFYQRINKRKACRRATTDQHHDDKTYLVILRHTACAYLTYI